MPRARAYRAAAAAAFLCAAIAGSAHAVEAPASLRPLVRSGEKASSFTLKGLDGKNVSFRAGDGKPALLVFWSAFCPLCRELTPPVSDIARRHAGRLRVIGINLDGDRFMNAVTSFVKENKVAFPVVLDTIRNDLFVASDPYGVEKTPTAVLIDGSGLIRQAHAAESMKGFVLSFDRHFSEIKKGPGGKK